MSRGLHRKRHAIAKSWNINGLPMGGGARPTELAGWRRHRPAILAGQARSLRSFRRLSMVPRPALSEEQHHAF